MKSAVSIFTILLEFSLSENTTNEPGSKATKLFLILNSAELEILKTHKYKKDEEIQLVFWLRQAQNSIFTGHKC